MVVICTDNTVKSWYNSKEILKEVVIMMFSISEIKKNPDGINFNSVLEIKEKLIERNKDVLDVKGIFVQGTISYDDGLYLLNYTLDYTITLPSSRSMLPVDVHQVEEVSEIFIEAVDIHAKEDLVRENLVLVLEEDYIDLEESAIDNILLTIPMQVLSEEEQNSDTMPSGNSWSVLTEEQYDALQDKKKKENNPFSALNGLFED
ncbi:putative ACR, COG1399 [Streptococcus gallolyticus subsp. gallolyticus TX20005]|nr:putative ACR, COG1399 [Streptococcus gallolyticus subsp. gallolyticus TX20005]